MCVSVCVWERAPFNPSTRGRCWWVHLPGHAHPWVQVIKHAWKISALHPTTPPPGLDRRKLFHLSSFFFSLVASAYHNISWLTTDSVTSTLNVRAWDDCNDIARGWWSYIVTYDSRFNRINRILISSRYTLFFESSSVKNSGVKHVWSEAILG
jgi:hypothetical protein